MARNDSKTDEERADRQIVEAMEDVKAGRSKPIDDLLFAGENVGVSGSHGGDQRCLLRASFPCPDQHRGGDLFRSTLLTTEQIGLVPSKGRVSRDKSALIVGSPSP
jgi:hypothetical protein